MRSRQCCSLLLLLAAFEAASAQGADEAALVRRAHLLRLEDTRRDEPAFVDSLLDGADARGRAEAALTVGRIAARRHAGQLRVLASTADTAVAASALFALGLMKDTATLAVGMDAIRGVPSVAVEAAWLLGELGERARPAIVTALTDSSLNAVARGAVLLAASRLRPVPWAAIAPWVASPDTAVAWRAAYALARGRSAAGVRTLLDAMSPANAHGEGRAMLPPAAVREQIARGLGRGVAGDSLAMRAREALRTLSADADARVRVNAVRSLASYGGDARASVWLALRDPDASVRLTSAQALEQVLDSSSTAWVEAFGADTAFVMQRTIADAGAKRGIVIDDIRRWRRNLDWQRRAAAVDIDARGPALAALGRLTPWREDRDGRVRAAASGAIATLADSPSVRSRARDILRSSLADPDVGVRSSALGALATGATIQDLRAALDAYPRSRIDRDNDARLAFWQVVDSALARVTSALPDSLAARLDALPRPTDPLERIAASRVARFQAWRDSTGTPRPMGWYLARIRESRSNPRPIARIQTERGPIELALYAEDAPLTVYNFATLARRGYFDGQRFHRVVPNFVVQGGDPRGDGNGGPGYAIRDEMNRRRYVRGTLGMALSGPNTGGSQFFVTHSPQPHLDGGYTIFGQLLSGSGVLDRLVQGDRIVRITIH